MTADFALLADRFLLASVFLLAGTAKLLDPAGSLKAFRDFGLPSFLARPMVVLLPVLELAVAVALIPVSFAWYGACGALALLIVFLLAVAVAMVRGRKPDCHCFGQVHSSPVGKLTLIRNAVLAACAGWLVSRGLQRTGPDFLTWFATLTATESKFAFVAACIVGFFFLQVLYGARAQSKAPAVEGEPEPESEPEEAQEARPAPAPRARPAPESREPSRAPVPAESPATAAVEYPASAALGPLNIGLAIGTPAPHFELLSLTGGTESLPSLLARGSDVLLIFSSPYCEPCQVLASNVPRWTRDLQAAPTIVFVSRGAVQENLAKLKDFDASRVLLQREFEIAALYDCDTTPTGVLVGVDGLIKSDLALGAPAIRKLLASCANSAGNVSAPFH